MGLNFIALYSDVFMIFEGRKFLNKKCLLISTVRSSFFAYQFFFLSIFNRSAKNIDLTIKKNFLFSIARHRLKRFASQWRCPC